MPSEVLQRREERADYLARLLRTMTSTMSAASIIKPMLIIDTIRVITVFPLVEVEKVIGL